MIKPHECVDMAWRDAPAPHSRLAPCPPSQQCAGYLQRGVIKPHERVDMAWRDACVFCRSTPGLRNARLLQSGQATSTAAQRPVLPQATMGQNKLSHRPRGEARPGAVCVRSSGDTWTGLWQPPVALGAGFCDPRSHLEWTPAGPGRCLPMRAAPGRSRGVCIKSAKGRDRCTPRQTCPTSLSRQESLLPPESHLPSPQAGCRLFRETTLEPSNLSERKGCRPDGIAGCCPPPQWKVDCSGEQCSRTPLEKNTHASNWRCEFSAP